MMFLLDSNVKTDLIRELHDWQLVGSDSRVVYVHDLDVMSRRKPDLVILLPLETRT
jgi:hypothetical protein